MFQTWNIDANGKLNIHGCLLVSQTGDISKTDNGKSENHIYKYLVDCYTKNEVQESMCHTHACVCHKGSVTDTELLYFY